MSKHLFDDFSPTTREEWLEKIKKDLKGKPLESLQWTSAEGLDLFPVFQKEDLPDPDWLKANFPGMTPFLRGNRAIRGDGWPWEIRHDFRAEKKEEVVQLINNIREDVGGIGLVLGLPFREFLFDWQEMDLPVEKPRDGINLRTAEDLKDILKGFSMGGSTLHLRAGHAALPLYCFLIHHWEEATGDSLSGMHATIDADPFNRLGADPSNQELLDLNLEDTAAIIFDAERRGLYLRALRVSLEPHHFMGANAVQQIACALAMTVDYIELFYARFGLEPRTILSHLHYQFPIDTNFFTEIAKLRAFRLLLHRLTEAYDKSGWAEMIPVHAHGSVRSMSSLDDHVNLLRSTTEAMSAIIGGASSISLPTYNSLTQAFDPHATRIARNIQIILRDESFFGQVMDPAGGSYYTEYLTAAFAEKAWKLFQKMEGEGGYLAVWRKGELIRTLRDQRRETDMAVGKGKKTLLGVNKFPNAKDEPPVMFPTGYKRDYPLPERDFFDEPVETRAKAMIGNIAQMGDLAACMEARRQRLKGNLGRTGALTRLGEAFEQLRYDAFQYEMDGFERPQAFLWTMGPRGYRNARAGFARNVFGVGGFATTDNASPEDLQETLATLQANPPQVIAYCSSNEHYFTEEVKQIMAAAKAALPDTQFFLAGNPEGWETLKEAGLIHDCLYAGMYMPQFLSDLHKTLDIKQEEPQYEA